ncbi:MAG TPA: hypothetical protein VGN00_19600 [Puia sp.]|jgi:hypothetical protein
MNCKDLIHPFQYDTGTSQSQRVLNDLLEGPAQLDGRTIADMLGYFRKFSRQINFYDEDGSIKDWQPFFGNSLPFTAAAIVSFRPDTITSQVAAYQKKFLRQPSKAGLGILVNYICDKVIKPFNSWNIQFHNTGLPIGNALDMLIKKNLSVGPNSLGNFIRSVNTAVKWFHIQPVDFSDFLVTTSWGLSSSDLTAMMTPADFKKLGLNKRARLVALYTIIAGSLTPFLKAINNATGAADRSLTQSFEALRDDLKQKHQPHLALIFAFLNLFRHLQDGLNGFTKSHLDFFYRQVLAIQPKGATPDKAHIVFTIQKQLVDYRLTKGARIKGPKDSNKADILFALDDEIVVNQAQVTDLRTLFVNNQAVADRSYVQGVYMAPVATKADGIDKDFQGNDVNSWPTLGARYSKYTDPENNFVHAYPNARLAFVLASPVLLMNEGARTIDITLSCTVSPIVDLTTLYQKVQTTLAGIYYYVNQDLIKQAVKTGIDSTTEQQLKTFLLSTRNKDTDPGSICYSTVQAPVYEATVTSDKWAVFSAPVQALLLPLFPPQRGLNISFSGDKDWVFPQVTPTIALGELSAATGSGDQTFQMTISAALNLEEAPVTFYNKDVLKEDIGTTDPCARIVLNDKVKLSAPSEVSLYHFFRNVVISDARIDVKACGLKKFVVQNDESIQDVNKPIYPFGTRPTIIDFDIVTTPQLPTPPPPPGFVAAGSSATAPGVAAAPAAPAAPKNLIGPNFYVGSQEIFCKKWTAVNINLNWKEKPSSFSEYYRAYWVDPNDPANYGLDVNGFEINVAALQKQNWLPEAANRKLFDNDTSTLNCSAAGYQQTIALTSSAFAGLTPDFHITPAAPLTKYEAATLYGFVRVNLQKQDFLAKDYAYVLARQMMALSKIAGNNGDGATGEARIGNAVYYNKAGEPIIFNTANIRSNVANAQTNLDDITHRLDQNILPHVDPLNTEHGISKDDADAVRYGLYNPNQQNDFRAKVQNVQGVINSEKEVIGDPKDFQAIIPNEPWTPIIQGISLDYSATATISDIDLIHLYPFDGTYKKEELTRTPTLFPAFFEEGTLFLGLDGLVPGSDLNILFQLAEATADTEEDPEPLTWSYLDHNVWKPLRTGFEILDDATDSLSTSGIVQMAIPGNITTDNTVMPSGHSWIMASIGSNSGIVAETIAVYTQAIRATFTDDPTNDTQRLDVALPASSLTKLETADANVKKVDQPYDSFGGRVPETDGYFYVRVSETLRHKGRAIQSCDYERIALDAFPQLFKAKCINHSIGLNAHLYSNDYPMAPGYVLLAVIPDLNQLKASATFQPRVPLSLLEQLEQKMQTLTSPFVRFRAMNPRYEKVDFCLQVKLLPDKDVNYYQQQLQDDIRGFMAPWSVGEFDKLRFGQVINRSDVIRFLETRDYLDYVIEWRWRHDEDTTVLSPADQPEVFPMTPRSILIAGNIDVKIIENDCPQWDTTPANNLNKVNIYKNGK